MPDDALLHVPASQLRQTPLAWQRWSIPFALMACIVLAFIDKISIAALFTDPSFETALGLQQAPPLKGLLMSVFLLCYGLSAFFLSGLGDWLGHKRLLLVMMLTWAGLVAGMGMVHSFHAMLVLRGLLGIAEGPLIALAYAIIKDVFPAQQLARASVLWLLGTPVGAMLGFPLTVYLLQHFGWRWTFYCSAGLSLLVSALVLATLRGPSPTAPKPVNAATWASRYQTYAAAIGSLTRNRAFWLVCVANLGAMAYLWGINSWLPSYVVLNLHVSRADSGLYTAIPFASMIAGEIIGAWRSDRAKYRSPLFCYGLLAAGLGLSALFLLPHGGWTLVAISFSAGSWGFAVAGVFALLAKVSGPDLSSTAGGIFNGLGNVSGALAAWLMGVLMTHTHSMNAGLAMLAAMIMLGGLLASPLRRRY